MQFSYNDLVQLIVFVQTIYIFPHDKQYFLIYISLKSTANQKNHTDIYVRNIMRDIQRKRLFPGQKTSDSLCLISENSFQGFGTFCIYRTLLKPKSKTNSRAFTLDGRPHIFFYMKF